jgi:peptidyl-tRNA hydrolase
VQKGVGPKGHNGVLSVEEQLGTGDFWRVRVGVDSREGTVRTSGEEYVLESFSEAEKKILDGVIDKVVEEIKNAVRI